MSEYKRPVTKRDTTDLQLKKSYGLGFSLFLIGIAIGLLLYPAVKYPYILLWVLLTTSCFVMAVSVLLWGRQE